MPVRTAKTFGPCTLNNYDEGDIKWLEQLECNVMTCSKEVGEEGTPHLQFSVTFKRSYSLAALKKLHNRIHWEFQECVQDNNYCRKRDSELIIDRDERKKKGARTDLETAREIVKTTFSMAQVVEATPNVQAIRSSELWLKYNEPPRPVGPIEVYWHWGPTGAGKTRAVYEKHSVEEIYRPPTFKFWEGYDGHKIVLLDDFRADFCKFHELLTLLDIYPFKVECKGGSREMRATTFYITSCYPPDSVYQTREDIVQLIRRITHIIEFNGVDG